MDLKVSGQLGIDAHSQIVRHKDSAERAIEIRPSCFGSNVEHNICLEPSGRPGRNIKEFLSSRKGHGSLVKKNSRRTGVERKFTSSLFSSTHRPRRHLSAAPTGYESAF